MKPVVHLLLTAVVGAGAAAHVSGTLLGAYSLVWLFPAYIISFLVNCIWWVRGVGWGAGALAAGGAEGGARRKGRKVEEWGTGVVRFA